MLKGGAPKARLGGGIPWEAPVRHAQLDGPRVPLLCTTRNENLHPKGYLLFVQITTIAMETQLPTLNIAQNAAAAQRGETGEQCRCTRKRTEGCKASLMPPAGVASVGWQGGQCQ